MTKSKKKHKPKLDKEDFAFVCELIAKGADQMLDDLWEDLSPLQDDDPDDPTVAQWYSDYVVEAEVALFTRVDYVLQQIARKFGYPRPLYPEDLETFKLEDTKPLVKTPAEAPAPPPLVLRRAEVRATTTP